MLAKAIGAEFRAVTEREHEGKLARVVTAERLYPTSPGDLWDALTNKARIPRWFSPVEGDLQLGGRYQVQGNAGGVITRCDPAEAFDITWEFAGATSWVRVRLEAEGEATRLTLEHIFAKSDADEHWAKYGPAAVGVGWDLSLLGLGRHIETGEALKLEEGEGWAASDEGKVFMRDSARAWADAHIAGGEDRETAIGMATRTATFYTGEDARL